MSNAIRFTFTPLKKGDNFNLTVEEVREKFNMLIEENRMVFFAFKDNIKEKYYVDPHRRDELLDSLGIEVTWNEEVRGDVNEDDEERPAVFNHHDNFDNSTRTVGNNNRVTKIHGMSITVSGNCIDVAPKKEVS